MWNLRFWLLVARAAGLFLLIDIGFYIWGFNRVQGWIIERARRRKVKAPSPSDAAIVERTFEAVRVGTRYYYRRGLDCLPRALTLYSLLRRRGIGADFCLGVKRFPFAGHAWVEYQGQVLDETPPKVRMYTLLSRA